MEQEKNLLNFTQEELFRYIQMQRRIYALEEYQLMKTDLLNKVKRVLDFRDLIKITESNCKKTRKIINKYAKQCKKESDTKKLFKKQEVEEEFIGNRHLFAVMDLMELVYKILHTDSFEKDLPALEKWYEFEMEDMVLVNGVIKGLKYADSSNVSEEDILNAINDAVEQYITCIEYNANYEDTFEKSFPYVYINKKKENADE